MNENESGRIAQATGEPFTMAQPPAWRAGWMSASLAQQDERDRNWHHRPPPHTCPRDATKVCVCCGECENVCRLRALVARVRKLFGRS